MTPKNKNMASKKLLIKDTKLYEKHKEFITHYPPLCEYIEDSQLSIETINKYHIDLSSYCCSQNEYFDKLLEEARNEEESDIPYERTINKRLSDFEKYLKEEGYTTNTIKKKRKTVQTIYRIFKITIPQNNQKSHEYLKYKEQIKESDLFNYFINVNRKIKNKSTINGYLSSLTGYCLFHKMTLEELIEEAENEEINPNIRKQKRTIKRRLEEYDAYLEKKYLKSTRKTKMKDIVFFFSEMSIDIPKLSKDKTQEAVRELRYDEIPTAKDVKRAIETAKDIKARALFAFCFTSGTASKETRNITVREYMEGTEYYHKEKTDIKRALEKMDGQTDVIPTFPMHRHKKNRDYYTCITPEANQLLINYLKTREGLTLDDKIFDYSRKGLINVFEQVNDLNDWGWVKDHRHRFFVCHQLRRANSNVLFYNEKLANMIQGRRFDATTEAYFKQNPKKVREEYLKYLEDFQLFSEYEVIQVTNDNYEKLQKQYDEMVEKKDNEIQELKDLLAETTAEIESNVNTQIEAKMEDMKKDLLSDLSPNEAKANTIRNKIYTYIQDNTNSLKIDSEDIPLVKELATTLALKYETIYNNGNGIKELIEKAKFELKLDKTLKKTLRENIEEDNKALEHIQDICSAILKYVEENDLSGAIGGQHHDAKIVGYLIDNQDKYTKSEITDRLIVEIIKEVMYYDDVEYY